MQNTEFPIENYSDKLNEKQLRALPLLGYGMSTHKVAEYLSLPHNTVLAWLRGDAIFREAVSVFRQQSKEFHQAKLQQIATLAWERVENLLLKEFEDGDKENRKLQMEAIKHVTGLLDLKTEKIQIEHKQADNLEPSSIDILAKRLKEKEENEIIDTPYRISVTDIDEPENSYTSMDTAEKIRIKYGLPKEEDVMEPKYIIYPEARYGVMTQNERGKFMCHICGEFPYDFVVHIRSKHNLSPSTYKKMYSIPMETEFVMRKEIELTDEDMRVVEENANK